MGERGVSMNQSGGLKIATVLVIAVLGFSTLAVGMQLSTIDTTAATHDQTETRSANQGNQTSSPADAPSAEADTIVCSSAFLYGIAPQRS